MHSIRFSIRTVRVYESWTYSLAGPKLIYWSPWDAYNASTAALHLQSGHFNTKGAFLGCVALKLVVVPLAAGTSIHAVTFEGCVRIEFISAPDGVVAAIGELLCRSMADAAATVPLAGNMFIGQSELEHLPLSARVKMLELHWWSPRLHQCCSPRAHACIMAALLVGASEGAKGSAPSAVGIDATSIVEAAEVELLPCLPTEIWIYLLTFLRRRDLGHFT